VEVDRICRVDRESDVRMLQFHGSDHSFVFIAQVALPTQVIQPVKIPLHPYTHPERVSQSVVLLPYVRPVQVTDLIIFIEGNQQAAVSKGQVSRHHFLLSSPFRRFARSSVSRVDE
jgi:hypothetical protein